MSLPALEVGRATTRALSYAPGIVSMRLELRELSAEALAELVRAPEGIHAAIAGAAQLRLDDTWHGLHYLLCGEPWVGRPPLDFVLNGGTPIGEEDVGQGPARGFDPMEVRAIAVALGAMTWEALWGRWDAEAVRRAALYQVDPDAPEREAARLEAAFRAARAFVTGLAEREQAMLVAMI
jgi:hypothetical protein